MDQIIKDYLRLEQIKKAFNISKELSIKKTCELLNISSSTFYMWKKKFKEQGEEGIKRMHDINYETLQLSLSHDNSLIF